MKIIVCNFYEACKIIPIIALVNTTKPTEIEVLGYTEDQLKERIGVIQALNISVHCSERSVSIYKNKIIIGW